jgi:N-acetylglucosaminyl-diphospho-decaprenol L-rhamnosyltransferase
MRPAVIDAVVATRDSRELVLECVEHLRSTLLERVVVVDNGSEDGTAGALRASRPHVDVVRLEEPASLSAAYNRGAERGSADLVLFLNDDIVASDESIAELARVLERRRDAVAAAGRLVDPGTGETQQEYQPRRFPTLTSFAATFLGLGPRWQQQEALDDSTVVPVDYAAGACLLVRRSVFGEVGGWDEAFEFWYEDVDLERRLQEHGLVLYAPTAPFEHLGGYSARRLSRAQLVSRHYRGALRYGQKHFGVGGRIGVGLLFGAVGTIRMLLARRSPADAEAYRLVVRRAGDVIRAPARSSPASPRRRASS